MTISLVSQQEFGNTGGTTNPVVLSPITADVGDWLVVVVHSASFGTTSSATDSAGNTWVQRVTKTHSVSSYHISILTCQVTSALVAGSVTVSYPGGVVDNSVNISRWTGISSVGPSNTGQNTNGNTAVSFIAGEAVVIAGISDFAGGAPTSVSDSFTAMTGRQQGWAAMTSAQAYRIVSGGTYGPAWTFPSSVSDISATLALIGTPAAYTSAEPFVANPRPMQPPTHIDQARVVNFVDVLVDPPTAEATITAQIPAALASLTAAAGPNESAGALDADLPAVTADLTGTAPALAVLDAVLPAAVALARGWAAAAGRITVVLPAVTGALPADADAKAQITGDLPAVTATWRASAPAAGVLEVVLPALTGSWTGRAPVAAVVAAALPSVAGDLAAVVATRRNVTLTLGPPRARSFTVTGPTGRDLNLGAPHGRALSVSAPHD